MQMKSSGDGNGNSNGSTRTHRCIVPGCTNQTELSEEDPVSAHFRYVCSGRASYGDSLLTHTRAEQLAALGRKYDPRKDGGDEIIHFQTVQFDPEIDNRSGPDHSIEGDDISDKMYKPGGSFE